MTTRTGGAEPPLFELADDIPASRGNGACRAPIGRRRAPRPRANRASPTPALLVEIRGMLQREFGELARRQREIERQVQQHGELRRADGETLARVLARLVAIERGVGLVEAPVAPRPSRRRPYGEH